MDSVPSLADADVRAFLSRRHGGGVNGIAEIGRGEWSVAYSFRHAGSDYVIRFGRQREDFEKDRIASVFRSARLSIPPMTEIGEAFDGFYAVSERMHGRFLDTLTEAEMRGALPSLFAALDAAREADVSGYGGYGVWDATGDAPYPTWRDALLAAGSQRTSLRIGGWRERMAASPVGTARFEEALACLRGMAEVCPNDRHLVHSDPLNRNILVKGDKISGVIDWGCALWGDFLYDLAHLSFSDVWYPAWCAIDFVDEAERHYESIGLDVPGLRRRVRCYEIHIGLEACKYQAFRGRWDELETTTRRTAQAVDRSA